MGSTSIICQEAYKEKRSMNRRLTESYFIEQSLHNPGINSSKNYKDKLINQGLNNQKLNAWLAYHPKKRVPKTIYAKMP